jgi:hypothetical protein
VNVRIWPAGANVATYLGSHAFYSRPARMARMPPRMIYIDFTHHSAVIRPLAISQTVFGKAIFSDTNPAVPFLGSNS